jgi:hypothetical protein
VRQLKLPHFFGESLSLLDSKISFGSVSDLKISFGESFIRFLILKISFGESLCRAKVFFFFQKIFFP